MAREKRLRLNRAPGRVNGTSADARRTAALEAVRRFHSIGGRSLSEMPNIPYGRAARVSVGGLRGEMLRKARAFADPERGYTVAEVEGLVRACDAAGYALTVSHVIKLLGVKRRVGRSAQSGGVDRAALQEMAIAGRWSRRRLEQEIRRVKARSGTGPTPAGRRVRTPATLDEAVDRLLQFCDHWGRLRHAAALACPPSDQTASNHAAGTTLPRAARAAVDRLDVAIVDLRKALART